MINLFSLPLPPKIKQSFYFFTIVAWYLKKYYFCKTKLTIPIPNRSGSETHSLRKGIV